MPNIKSAKKRVITSAKKAENNNVITTRTKTSIKKFIKEVETGNKEAATEKLNVAVKNIDKAASSGLIHENKAAREKSRLTKMRNNMQ
ncbi:MAG: 30S ribosomal protein S20 [Bacilli bacterium]|nr:30S ribosomal protein S20 [Bacilli bacterium]